MEITKLELIQKPINLPGDGTSYRNYIAFEIAGERLEMPFEPMISTDEYVSVFKQYLEKIQSKTNDNAQVSIAANQGNLFEETKGE